MAALEVLLTFLRLGLTSFGGPIAHLSFFHNVFVKQKKWISDQAYADLVALCQFLPGPASSQVGMALGLSRAGLLGAVCAWIGFTLPAAILLVLFALGISTIGNLSHNGYLHGLKIAALCVVAQAIWIMAQNLCPDKERATLALFSAMLATAFSSGFGQILAIILGGLFGLILVKDDKALPLEPLKTSLNKKSGVFFLSLFFLLLFLLPLFASIFNNHTLQFFESFYKAGSLVFGGGHVILPLLEKEVVNNGWVSADNFMTGYGVTQGLPGPLFSFTAYLGAIASIPPNKILGAFIAVFAGFLPSFLLILGIIPFWNDLRKSKTIRRALVGINAAVVGLLLSAIYDPVWINAVFSVKDFLLAAFGFVLLVMWKMPSWMVVIVCAVLGKLLSS